MPAARNRGCDILDDTGKARGTGWRGARAKGTLGSGGGTPGIGRGAAHPAMRPQRIGGLAGAPARLQ